MASIFSTSNFIMSGASRFARKKTNRPMILKALNWKLHAIEIIEKLLLQLRRIVLPVHTMKIVYVYDFYLRFSMLNQLVPRPTTPHLFVLSTTHAHVSWLSGSHRAREEGGTLTTRSGKQSEIIGVKYSCHLLWTFHVTWGKILYSLCTVQLSLHFQSYGITG